MERFWRVTRDGGAERLPLWRWPYDAVKYKTARALSPARERLFLRKRRAKGLPPV